MAGESGPSQPSVLAAVRARVSSSPPRRLAASPPRPLVGDAVAAPPRPAAEQARARTRSLADVTVEQGIYAALTLLALGMRLALLGDKPLHHDESLHATFTWYLFTGRGYHYDPLMHGPFQFLVTSAIFALVGVSDFTTRLLPALLGTAIVPLPFLLRRELGRVGALFSAVVLTLSPSFLYFSRFYRDDIYVACFTLGMAMCFWRFLRSRRPGWFVAALALLSLSFTAMENTFITAFIFGTFVLLTLVYERWSPDRQVLLAAIRTINLDAALAGFAAFVLIFAFFFTTAFTWPRGLQAGVVKGLQYWLAQQPVARGGEPWWFYVSLLLPYEPLEIGLAIAGVVVALRRRARFELFLVWWAALSMIIYSWAGEKMPWLILHPLLPLVLLAGVAIQALVTARRTAATVLAWLGVAVGGVYMLHAAIPLSYYHPADPAEMLVYTQTSTDVLAAMDQVDAVALRSGMGKQMPIMVDGEDWWPFVWYLRDYTSASVGTSRGGVNPPIVIVSDVAGNETSAAAALQPNYVEEHLKLREWWIPDWHAQSIQNWWNWLMYRRNWNDKGSTDFYMFIRKDLAGGL